MTNLINKQIDGVSACAPFHGCTIYPENVGHEGIQVQIWINDDHTVTFGIEGQWSVSRMHHTGVHKLGAALVQAAVQAKDMALQESIRKLFIPGARVTYDHDNTYGPDDSGMTKEDVERMRGFDNCPGIVLSVEIDDGDGPRYVNVEVFDALGHSMVIHAWSVNAFKMRE